MKRFRESREITVHVGQGRKPQVNEHDLWALRWHCIRNRHAAVLNITTWAQEYHCHLPQYAASSRNATRISVTLGESYTSILCSDAAGFFGPELISDSQKDSENVCCSQMSPHFNLFLEKMDFEFSVPQSKETIQAFISDKSKCLSCMGVQQSKQHGWLKYVRRYHWHGGIYWDCTETYTAVEMIIHYIYIPLF